jgi:transcription antitermination factor NusG
MCDENKDLWFVVQVLYRHERKVALILEHNGYQQFLPTYRAARKWSDRTKVLQLPLFPTYVFCRSTRVAIGNILAVPGVNRIVSFGGMPAPVPDEEIDSLQKAVMCGLTIMPVSEVFVGQKVQIDAGPLIGVTGVLTEIRNERWLVISVSPLMRSIAVTVNVPARVITHSGAGHKCATRHALVA